MKVSCQACGAKYTIADDKVRGRKVKIRCKSCGTPIVVDGQSEAPAAPAPGGGAAAAAVPAAAAGPSISWSVNLSDTDQRTMTTEEIVAGWKSGEVTSDAFVWKDGMGDWVPILDSPDLAPLLSAGAQAAPAGDPAGTPFGPTIVTAPTESARLSGGGRGAGVDLFNAAAATAAEEDEIATSAPALPQAGSTAYDDGKMTGARNENSVLFSLDSLKSGLGPDNKKSPPARKAASSTTQNSDPFAMSPADVGGGNALFSLNTNQALLTAPAAPEPPPPRLDASGAPAKPMNKALVYGGGGAAAVLLLGIGLLLGRSGNKEGPAPDASAKVATADSADSDKKSDAKDKDDKDAKKDDEKKDEKPAESAAASASAAPSATPAPTAKVASTGGEHKSTGTSTPSTPKEPKEPKAAAPKPEEMPSQGSAPFSVSAAQVALTQAAANASSCAKPGGPTGSGKVQVTFATSGRVTTANVAGPPFGGTPVGGCVAGVFRKARIPAFAGNPVTVSKSFAIH